jgi:hypothetical protein
MKFDVNDFQNEIDAIKEKIEIFQRSEEEADESFLAVGDLLVGVENDKQLKNKAFTALKNEVAKSLNNDGIRNINKVVAVAQCDVIQANKERLPKSWSSLYLLSRMENLAELIESEQVTPTTTRAGINALKEKPQANPRIVVELITEEYITAELIAELTAALSNTSWSFVIK